MSKENEERVTEPDVGETPAKQADTEIEKARERISGLPPVPPEEQPENHRDRASYIDAFNLTASTPWLGYEHDDES